MSNDILNRRAKRAAAEVRRITKLCRQLCEEMGWKGFTLKFENYIDPKFYDKKQDNVA